MLKTETITDPYLRTASDIHRAVPESTEDWVYAVVRLFEDSDIIKKVGETIIDGHLLLLEGRHKPSVRIFAWLLVPASDLTMLLLSNSRDVVAWYTPEETDIIIDYLFKKEFPTLSHLMDFIIEEEFDDPKGKIRDIIRQAFA